MNAAFDLFADAQPVALPASTNGTVWEEIARPLPAPFVPELAARAKLGVGDDWCWCEVARVDDDITIVVGAVPIGTKRNGRPKWPLKSECQKVYVTRGLEEAAALAWEEKHGKCVRCGGTGYNSAGFRTIAPSRYAYAYRTCDKCGGDGAPKRAEGAA